MSDHPSRFPPEQPPPGGYGPPPDYGSTPGYSAPPPADYGAPQPPGYGAPQPPGYEEPLPPAYGYGAPPSGYGSPPPGYGPPPGGLYGEPAPPPGRNGFAIASLICGIVAPCGAGLLSIIFGILALFQIRKSGQRGKGFAIGGLAATGVWLVGLGVLGVVAVLNSSADRDPTGEIAEGGQIALEDLAAGDCVNGLQEEQATAAVPAVPCAEPHEGEVYALLDVVLDGDWPGEEAIFEEANTGCLDQLAGYSAAAYEDDQVDFFYFYPSEATWLLGDREVICIAYFLDGPRTGALPR